jgi:hypothetical protein
MTDEHRLDHEIKFFKVLKELKKKTEWIYFNCNPPDDHNIDWSQPIRLGVKFKLHHAKYVYIKNATDFDTHFKNCYKPKSYPYIDPYWCFIWINPQLDCARCCCACGKYQSASLELYERWQIWRNKKLYGY